MRYNSQGESDAAMQAEHDEAEEVQRQASDDTMYDAMMDARAEAQYEEMCLEAESLAESDDTNGKFEGEL